MRVLPGDPAIFFASDRNAGQAEIEQIREQMGLRQADPAATGASICADIATGNLGRLMTTGQPVLADLKNRLPARSN